MICNSESSYFFSRSYSESPYGTFMAEIGTVDYYKCERCGFVFSKTHHQLEESKWNDLNRLFHDYIENSDSEKPTNQPPYAEQAMMISFLGRNGIINTKNMIDYAAGYGTLSNILAKYYDIDLPLFDPYVQSSNPSRYIDKADLKTYQTVINSAMFEHVLRREDLDQINSIVDSEGCLIIHTVICENIPKDPNWFYFLPPVHTAFHTNKSMEILMKQWNYRSSIYSPKSKCWVLLRDNIDVIEKKIKDLNEELQSTWFYCKNGFVDYWKGF